jgi:hypothetical protein
MYIPIQEYVYVYVCVYHINHTCTAIVHRASLDLNLTSQGPTSDTDTPSFNNLI